MAVRLLSPSSFAFNDSNYDNTNANAGSRSHLGIKNLKRRKPHLLVDYTIHTVSETQYMDVFFYALEKECDETR